MAQYGKKGDASRLLTFCVTGKTGLGHLRRIANVAAAVRLAAPAVGLAVVSNASLNGIGPEEQELFARADVVERPNMARHLADVAHGPIVVDTAVIPDLELLPWPLYLILRETITERLGAFRLPAGRLWDEVFVAAPRGEWTVPGDAVGAGRISYVGWIHRSASAAEDAPLLPRKGSERIVLVATGGGGTAETASALAADLDPVIARTRALLSGTSVVWRVLQVLGPRAPVDSRLTQADAIVEVGSRLDRAFSEADAVVSTAGYNSVLELAGTDTPTLLCPITRTYDDQVARAARWAQRLGLAHSSNSPERSARWLASVLKSGQRRTPIELGPCGSGRVAEALAARIDETLVHQPGAGFIKKYDNCGLAAATCGRASALFRAGVPTLGACGSRAPTSLAFARLDGATAAEDWGKAQTSSARVRLAAEIMTPLAALHRAGAAGLDLQGHDALKRVLPRLETGATAANVLGVERVGRIAAAAQQLRRWEAAAGSGHRPSTVVHGDFHLGQLIRPKGRSGFVLLDLDDLATGAREVDIGNCVAHIVTSPQLHAGPIDSGVEELLAMFIDAYEATSASSVDAIAAARWCTAALLRRILKLAEQRRAAPFDELIAATIELCKDAVPTAEATIDHSPPEGAEAR